MRPTLLFLDGLLLSLAACSILGKPGAAHRHGGGEPVSCTRSRIFCVVTGANVCSKIHRSEKKLSTVVRVGGE